MLNKLYTTLLTMIYKLISWNGCHTRQNNLAGPMMGSVKPQAPVSWNADQRLCSAAAPMQARKPKDVWTKTLHRSWISIQDAALAEGGGSAKPSASRPSGVFGSDPVAC